jgi:magnesium-transporting ATPase (P-type)
MTRIQYRRLFRATVLAGIVLTVTAGVVRSMESSRWPEALRAYDQSRADPPTFEIIIGLLFIVLTIVTAVGLYRFWRPARPLYLMSMGLAILVSPALPPEVLGGGQAALMTAAAMVAGVMVGLMYFSPVAQEFEPAAAAGAGEPQTICLSARGTARTSSG